MSFGRRRVGPKAPKRKPRWRRGVERNPSAGKDATPGDVARMRELRQQVEGMAEARAAARVFPRLRRGKKCPPMAMIPPSDRDPKKVRHLWFKAGEIARRRAQSDTDDE